MSSGKISTYLQHGIPVLVNEIGEMADYVRDHALGIVVESPKDIPEKLARFDPETCRENCYTFFAEKLDLDETITPLLKEIETILSC
jgi:glycosyltransferase involved in cell wall biosynthesis